MGVLIRRSPIFLLFCLYVYANARGSEVKGSFILLAKGHRLLKSLIKETKVFSAMHCIQQCLIEDPHCKSVNYGTTSQVQGTCQLNNNSAIGCNEMNLVADFDFDYFERDSGVSSFCPAPATKPEAKQVKAKSCADLYKHGERQDGIYRIDPDDQGDFDVRCDMSTSTGGWTVFQRRIDGSQDFYRGWDDYKQGFGDLNGEFWLGLNKIRRISKSGENVLRIDLKGFRNETRYAEYGKFTIAGETVKYKLTVGNYSGSAGNSLAYHNGMNFTTKDVDNDRDSEANCAVKWSGAWWYNSCHQANLNGLYSEKSGRGIRWNSWQSYPIKKTEMKIRPDKF